MVSWHIELMVVSPVFTGHCTGVRQFVELGIATPNRECLNGYRGIPCHEACNSARIDATTQENTQWYVANHADANSILEDGCIHLAIAEADKAPRRQALIRSGVRGAWTYAVAA